MDVVSLELDGCPLHFSRWWVGVGLLPAMTETGEPVLVKVWDSKLLCSENFLGVLVHDFKTNQWFAFLLCPAHQQTRDNELLSYFRETMKIIVTNIFNCFEPHQPVNIGWTLHCVQIVAAVQSHWNRHWGDASWVKTWIPAPALALINCVTLDNSPLLRASAISSIHKE
jgi:hypothetical protein